MVNFLIALSIIICILVIARAVWYLHSNKQAEMTAAANFHSKLSGQKEKYNQIQNQLHSQGFHCSEQLVTEPFKTILNSKIFGAFNWEIDDQHKKIALYDLYQTPYKLVIRDLKDIKKVDYDIIDGETTSSSFGTTQTKAHLLRAGAKGKTYQMSTQYTKIQDIHVTIVFKNPFLQMTVNLYDSKWGEVLVAGSPVYIEFKRQAEYTVNRIQNIIDENEEANKATNIVETPEIPD